MATYNGEDALSNDGDDIQAWEIERFFKHKLKSFLATDHIPNQAPQPENKFDIEKELLSFLNDFESFKKTQDNKSVTSEDVDDEGDDDDEDESGESESESEDDGSSEDGEEEEGYEDDASVVVEGSVSGLSAKDLDLIEALTDSRQRGERANVEKQLSLLDLDEDGLDRQLKQPQPDDFLSTFQEEMNKLKTETGSEGKQERKNKICYVCKGEIQNIGSFKKSLEAHQKEPFHILKWEESRKASPKSEVSSVIGDAPLPDFIFVNGNNHFCCKICSGRPIGKYRNQFLQHMQSEEHRANMQTRFDLPSNKKQPRNVEKKEEVSKKAQSDDEKDDASDKVVPKNDKLAYAIGFACIKPATENQLICTMCDKYIPVARDMSTLMKNLSHHIESKAHVSKMEGLQESLKTIKENPSVQEAKKKLTDNVYKFICLPCEFDGYGFQFCKSHLKNGEHNSKIKVLLDAKVPVNFGHGVKCVGCNKHIYGAQINIDEHCVKCIKENEINSRRGPGRVRNRPPRRPRNDGNRETKPKHNAKQGPKVRNQENKEGKAKKSQENRQETKGQENRKGPRSKKPENRPNQNSDQGQAQGTGNQEKKQGHGRRNRNQENKPGNNNQENKPGQTQGNKNQGHKNQESRHHNQGPKKQENRQGQGITTNNLQRPYVKKVHHEMGVDNKPTQGTKKPIEDGFVMVKKSKNSKEDKCVIS